MDHLLHAPRRRGDPARGRHLAGLDHVHDILQHLARLDDAADHHRLSLAAEARLHLGRGVVDAGVTAIVNGDIAFTALRNFEGNAK